MIDAMTAAKVAKAAGLTLPDARALAALADTEEQAKDLAVMFAADEETFDVDD